MDDATERAAAIRDPDGFIAQLPERVVIDEVQRAPELFLAIKASVDRNRRPGRFLLTGSANALVLPRVADSLTGRIEIQTLRPFSQGELTGGPDGFVDACLADGFQVRQAPAEPWPKLVDRIVRGGFPAAVERMDEQRRSAWFGSYATTMLERDVRNLANIQHLNEMPRLLKLVAARSAGLLNQSDLARDARLPLTTLQRHWALLEAIFFVRTIPAWSGNLSTRLVRAPKALLCDSGLHTHLLHLDAARLKADELMAGAALETFVGGELMRQIDWSAARPQLLHFRSQSRQEVDFLLEDRRGRVVGIEVKKTASPDAGDFKGLRHLQEALGPRFLRGILLHTGSAGVAFGRDLFAMPVSALWETATAPA
jgi:hypothetical protein